MLHIQPGVTSLPPFLLLLLLCRFLHWAHLPIERTGIQAHRAGFSPRSLLFSFKHSNKGIFRGLGMTPG